MRFCVRRCSSHSATEIKLDMKSHGMCKQYQFCVGYEIASACKFHTKSHMKLHLKSLV
jgi:hypothetical protein